MLRTSILYASECYYNISENELRTIERIEESYLRQIASLKRFCSLPILYLDLGEYPARFEIMKLRLLFLKYILEQKEESTIFNFFTTQQKMCRKGDWAKMCENDLKKLDIKLSYSQIREMKIVKYKQILNEKIKNEAFKYFHKKMKSQGKEIKYNKLETAEYLLPNN